MRRSPPARSASMSRATTRAPMRGRSRTSSPPITTRGWSRPTTSPRSTGSPTSSTSRSPTPPRCPRCASVRWRASTSPSRCRATGRTRPWRGIAARCSSCARTSCARCSPPSCARPCSAPPGGSGPRPTGHRARCAPRQPCRRWERAARRVTRARCRYWGRNCATVSIRPNFANCAAIIAPNNRWWR